MREADNLLRRVVWMWFGALPGAFGLGPRHLLSPHCSLYTGSWRPWQLSAPGSGGCDSSVLCDDLEGGLEGEGNGEGQGSLGCCSPWGCKE